jgi:two-component system torCAD operon response regulator TorR
VHCFDDPNVQEWLTPWSAPYRRTRRPHRIVVVEDDPVTRAILLGYFRTTVTWSASAPARNADRRCASVLISSSSTSSRPTANGFELANKVQALSNAGIIFVTHRDSRGRRQS